MPGVNFDLSRACTSDSTAINRLIQSFCLLASANWTTTFISSSLSGGR